MDVIEKALRKLAPLERAWVAQAITKLIAGNTAGLDIKKLRGADNIFRVRKGDIRVIYQKKDGRISLLLISRRNEQTYDL